MVWLRCCQRSDLNLTSRSGKVASGCFVLAMVLQSAFVWDYAIESNRRAGAILSASPQVGRGVRVGTLLVDIRGRYRSNPLLHADCLLGVGTGNIIWSNYETRHYYFPVQVRPGLDEPPSSLFEQVAMFEAPNADERARVWAELLDQHGEAIDVVLSWGHDSELEAINARWAGAEPLRATGPVQVYRQSMPRNGLVHSSATPHAGTSTPE